MTSRIEIHTQIKAFYSIVFNEEFEFRPTHVSLYMFFLNQNNRNMWVEWFKCPFDLAMQGACINSKTTYYAILDDLVKFKLIEYRKGLNNFKAPHIKIIPLTVPKIDTLTDTVTVPQSEPLSVPLPVPLTGNIYILLTNNLKRIIENLKDVLKFLDDKENTTDTPETKNGETVIKKRKREPFKIPTIAEVRMYFKDNGYKEEVGEDKWHYYNDANWFDSHGNAVLNWKQKMRSVWFKPENKINGAEMSRSSNTTNLNKPENVT
jgi:hypothetical protein